MSLNNCLVLLLLLVDVRIMEKIFHWLDIKFENIVVTIEEIKNLQTMSLEQLQEPLEAYVANPRKKKRLDHRETLQNSAK